MLSTWCGKSRLMTLGTSTFATPIPMAKITVPPNNAAIDPSDRKAIPATASARQPASVLSRPSEWGEARKDQQRQRGEQSRRRT